MILHVYFPLEFNYFSIKHKLTTYCWYSLEVCSEMKCLWNLMGLPPPYGTQRNEMGRIFCEGKMEFGLRIPAHHGHQCQKVSCCCLAQLLQTCFCSVQSHLPHQPNSPWLLVSVFGTPAGIPGRETRSRTLARHRQWITSNRERRRNPHKLLACHANKAGTNTSNPSLRCERSEHSYILKSVRNW